MMDSEIGGTCSIIIRTRNACEF